MFLLAILDIFNIRLKEEAVDVRVPCFFYLFFNSSK